MYGIPIAQEGWSIVTTATDQLGTAQKTVVRETISYWAFPFIIAVAEVMSFFGWSGIDLPSKTSGTFKP